MITNEYIDEGAIFCTVQSIIDNKSTDVLQSLIYFSHASQVVVSKTFVVPVFSRASF